MLLKWHTAIAPPVCFLSKLVRIQVLTRTKSYRANYYSRGILMRNHFAVARVALAIGVSLACHRQITAQELIVDGDCFHHHCCRGYVASFGAFYISPDEGEAYGLVIARHPCFPCCKCFDKVRLFNPRCVCDSCTGISGVEYTALLSDGTLRHILFGDHDVGIDCESVHQRYIVVFTECHRACPFLCSFAYCCHHVPYGGVPEIPPPAPVPAK